MLDPEGRGARTRPFTSDVGDPFPSIIDGQIVDPYSAVSVGELSPNETPVIPAQYAGDDWMVINTNPWKDANGNPRVSWWAVRRAYTDTGEGGPPTEDSGGRGGGGYGYGGGGGLDYTAPDIRWQIEQNFDYWFGRGNTPSWLVDKAMSDYELGRTWTEDDYKYYSLRNGADGMPARDIVWDIEDAAFDIFGDDWSNVVNSAMVVSLAADPLYTGANAFSQAQTYFRNLPEYDVLSDMASQDAIKHWEDLTGKPLSYTAQNVLRGLVGNDGLTPDELTYWKTWVEGTDSARSGPYGVTIENNITDTFNAILRRDPTDSEIDQLFDMQPVMWLDFLRGTDEYAIIYEGMPEDMKEEDWLAFRAEADAVWRSVYGVNTTTFIGPEGDIVPQEETNIPVHDAPIDFVTSLYERGITPKEWQDDMDATQNAVVFAAQYNPVLLETLGIELTPEQWFTYSSKAEGWGGIQNIINDATNKIAYREYYRNYYGVDPDPEDYVQISTSYVSPTEFANRMAARETAKAKYEEVNDLTERVLGKHVSMTELENWAMRGQDSGKLDAMLSQAARLDQYRWVHKQYYGVEPTPEDYAKYAGYATPQELQWELQVTEKIAELGPELSDIWRDYWKEELAQEDLTTLIGETQGYGAISAKMREAQRGAQQAESERRDRYTQYRAETPITSAQQGGFQITMPGMAPVGGMKA